MKDILDAAVGQFRERLSSPLMASFLISWPIWNYKFVLIFFSDMKPYVKFSYISSQVYPDFWHGAFYGVAGPLLTACFYVGFYPFIVYGSEAISNWHRVRLERQRIKNNEETPLSAEQAKKLRQDFREQTKKYDADIDEAHERIKALKIEFAASEQRLAEVSSSESNLRIELAAKKSEVQGLTKELSSVTEALGRANELSDIDQRAQKAAEQARDKALEQLMLREKFSDKLKSDINILNERIEQYVQRLSESEKNRRELERALSEAEAKMNKSGYMKNFEMIDLKPSR